MMINNVSRETIEETKETEETMETEETKETEEGQEETLAESQEHDENAFSADVKEIKELLKTSLETNTESMQEVSIFDTPIESIPLVGQAVIFIVLIVVLYYTLGGKRE